MAVKLDNQCIIAIFSVIDFSEILTWIYRIAIKHMFINFIVLNSPKPLNVKTNKLSQDYEKTVILKDIELSIPIIFQKVCFRTFIFGLVTQQQNPCW